MTILYHSLWNVLPNFYMEIQGLIFSELIMRNIHASSYWSLLISLKLLSPCIQESSGLNGKTSGVIVTPSNATWRSRMDICCSSLHLNVVLWSLRFKPRGCEEALSYRIQPTLQAWDITRIWWIDTYLSLLNASIRPTHIKLALEDALYIPILAENPNITSPNPFEIPNFVRNEAYFYGFIALMKENKKWNFRAIAGDVLGRPDGCSIGTKPTVYVLGSTWKAILT